LHNANEFHFDRGWFTANHDIDGVWFTTEDDIDGGSSGALCSKEAQVAFLFEEITLIVAC